MFMKEKMEKFIVEFYETENGNVPVEEFLKMLDVKMRYIKSIIFLLL